MRKTWILLAIVAMIAGLLAAPGTALAKPGNGNGHDKENTGYTCADYKAMYESDNDSFSVGTVDATPPGELKFEVDLGAGETACWDVTGTRAGDWTITAEANEAYVANIALQIKDSVPGDLCYRNNSWISDEILGSTYVTVGVPEAIENACTDDDPFTFSDDAPSLVFLAASSDTGKGKKSKTVGTVAITVELP
jgi:hypothetical protein